MTPAARLRELLAQDGLIVAPGVYDGISAAIARQLGFAAAYMTGAGVSAAAQGLPDVGLLTLTEMAERARTLAGLLGETPLIADADTGYGSPVNVARTIAEYEAAGVAAIQLEDQVFPKRCGHLAGKEVIATEDFERSLNAALEARRDPDTVIVARTDARAPHGLDEAIARGRRYAEAGADVIFVEAPQSEEELQRIAEEIDAPLLVNLVEGGRTPQLDAQRLAELGYRIAIHPVAAVIAATEAAIGALRDLKPDAPPLSTDHGVEGFFELFGLSDWVELGQRYEG